MIISADRIITGDGKTVLHNQAVYVKAGKLADMGAPEALKEKYPGQPFTHYENATLMPGLIDMHVHIGYWWSEGDAHSYNDFMIAYMAGDYVRRALARGVTTIRDVSSPRNLCATMIKSARKGFIESPRIIHTDGAICFTGGHGWSLTGGTVEADGPWAVRAAIRDAIKRGAQWIKIMASHRTNTPEYTQEELNAAVDECHRVGIKAAVHAGTQPSIQMCIDAGFDTIEHGTYLTVEQARQMAQKGLVWVPTITAYTLSHEHIVEAMKSETANAVESSFVEHHAYFESAAAAYRDNFKALYETGVKIVTGTDVVFTNRPVTPVDLEIQYMTRYGMPALEAIGAATGAGAETLGLETVTGQIAPGLEADMVVVWGNPLEDIAAVSNVREVFLGGRPVHGTV